MRWRLIIISVIRSPGFRRVPKGCFFCSVLDTLIGNALCTQSRAFFMFLSFHPLAVPNTGPSHQTSATAEHKRERERKERETVGKCIN